MNSRARGGLQAYCKLCHRESTRLLFAASPERRAKLAEVSAKRLVRNKAYVLAHLMANPCVDCGETSVVLLEHDHVRGKKTAAVTFLMYRKVPLQKLLEEIAKCDVRCVSCHRLKTSEGNGSYRLGRSSNEYLAQALLYWKQQTGK